MDEPKSVLVVDDEVHIRCVVQQKLENAGYRVSLAASAEEAQRLLEAAPPALLITDLRMPGMSGLELTVWLRGQAALRDVPVLMLTGSVTIDTDLKAECARLRVCAMSKPFSLRKLMQVIEAIFNSPAADCKTVECS